MSTHQHRTTVPPPIAIVAAACEYPDAGTPEALSELSLFGRQAFRRFPDSRIALGPYLRGDDDPDSIYPIEAGLIEGYVFDRERFVVPASTFEATDLSHWLALDVADRALSALPGAWHDDNAFKDRTGVIVANTLTGEFARAGLLRYRWPYVEHHARESARSRMTAPELESFLGELERAFKAPFPAPDSDSLAGGLSNTIAGRIANHFGFRGGAHAVDGACASSLVGVVTACERLRGGQLDCAVVGAVDLSLDPFELVGFARNGALARSEMRVFDRDSEGFWPGEGCGFVVLMTEQVASARSVPVLGWIRGTGMSSDGQGGLTRPTTEGQLLALQRAWSMAGVTPAKADYFEAHGTGTPTGDPVEILALARLVAAEAPRQRIPVGSIKANIGHTKAAAGLAGLIKALGICAARVVPPTAGHHTPHEMLAAEPVRSALRIPTQPEPVDHADPVLIGINSFGFGGINCHVVVEGPAFESHQRRTPPTVAGSGLRGELVTVSATTRDDLIAVIELVRRRATTLSRAQLADLAAAMPPSDQSGWRACMIASLPQDLETAAGSLKQALASGPDQDRGFGARWSWSAPVAHEPRVAFLFPGQGGATDTATTSWVARFPFLADAAAGIAALRTGGAVDTSIVQPLLAEIAIASLGLLARMGLRAHAVLGHSFGELSALHAAGAFDEGTFRTLAARRGRAMRELGPPGAMLSVEVDRAQAYALAADHGVDVACHNGPRRHVLAGPVEAIDALAASCKAAGIGAVTLPTDRAFHSRLMHTARRGFEHELAATSFHSPAIPVASSVTGCLLGDAALDALLSEQFIAPVKFDEAIRALGPVDLILELGCGAGLAGLVAQCEGPVCLPAPLFDVTLEPLLAAVGAWWVCGGSIDTGMLQAGRLIRPYRLGDEPLLLSNPCGIASDPVVRPPAPLPKPVAPPGLALPAGKSSTAVDILLAIVCDVAGLSRRSVTAQSRLLADLHLNSIRARHVVAAAARQLGIAKLPFNLGEIANVSIGDVARQLEMLRTTQEDDAAPARSSVPGIEPWVRCLHHRWQTAGDASAHATPRTRPRFRIVAAGGSTPRAILDAVDVATADDERDPVLLFLDERQTDAALAALVAVAGILAASASAVGLLVLQGSRIANGFLRSLAQEVPQHRICVVEYERLDDSSIGQALSVFEQQPGGLSERRLRGADIQSRSVGVVVPVSDASCRSIGPADVALITGGAKGIGAATARFLGERYRCRIALVGRSPNDDPEVAATVAALSAGGVLVEYVQADLTDAVATAGAITRIRGALGDITVLVHAAGVNHPTAARDLTFDQARATVAAKVDSLDHVLRTMTPGRLRLLVAFASIIGEFGLAGEAHYALANEWMTERIAAYARLSPQTRCIPIAWSAWRETGMAARLDGVLDELSRSDTRPLDNAEALEVLGTILESGLRDDAIIVTGRHGRAIDPVIEAPTLHRYRFLETPRVFYPGIELVADAEVSTDSDRYLLDHAPYGLPVFPLVAAIEAMLSAACSLDHGSGLPAIEDLRIGDAVTCSRGQTIVLRTSALKRSDGSILASVRCSSSDFDVDHFSCVVRRQQTRPPTVAAPVPTGVVASAHRALYNGLSFHGPLFQRLDEYRQISATACVATTIPGRAGRWFGPFQPNQLVAGDPAIRDAVLHALQVCIPQHPVLPVAAAKVEPGLLSAGSAVTVSARQTHGNGREFTFDIDVLAADGAIIERWIGLRVARVPSDSANRALRCALDPALLASYAGRLLLDELGEPVACVGACDTAGQGSSLRALRRATGTDIVLRHCDNGAPEVDGLHVSITHTDEMTLAVGHRAKRIACDIEDLSQRDAEEWCLMLGERRWVFARDLAAKAGLEEPVACLLIWSVSECLVKLGRLDWPFEVRDARVAEAPHTGPVALLSAGIVRVAVGVAAFGNHRRQTSVAIAVVDAVADDPDSPVAVPERSAVPVA